MALTATQLATRATREARQGQSPTTVKIYVSQAALLIPKAMMIMAEQTVNDGDTRHLLMRLWGAGSIALTDGELDLTAAGYEQLLHSGIQYSEAYDVDGYTGNETQAIPLAFTDQSHRLQFGASVFGNYSVRNNKLVARDSSNSPIVNLRFIAPYIPDLSATYPLPDDLEDKGQTILASLLLQNAVAQTAQDKAT